MRPHPDKAALAQALQDMRRKVIAMLMAWKPELFGLWSTARMRYLPDMDKIYAWINTYGHCKPKWLNKYTYDELVTLVSQVEKITAQHGKPKAHPKQKSGNKGGLPPPPKD